MLGLSYFIEREVKCDLGWMDVVGSDTKFNVGSLGQYCNIQELLDYVFCCNWFVRTGSV